MPVYRVSRPASSVSCSVSGKATSTLVPAAASAYPHNYYYHHRTKDDSTVSDGRSSHTYSHCYTSSSTASKSGGTSGRLSRSHSARSLRSSGSSHKQHHHNYYDYYDYHENEGKSENIESHLHQKKIDLSAYSPVFSVALRENVRHQYDAKCRVYVSKTVTTSTRTVRKKYKDCGHDQIAMTIRCAQRTDEVVRAFERAVDMDGWTMSVNVPTEGKATVTVTEHHHVAKRQGRKKKQIMQKKRPSSTPLNDLLYANGRGTAAYMQHLNSGHYTQYDDSDDEEDSEQEMEECKVKKSVPALVEDIVPGTKTYFCNSGWVKPARSSNGHKRSTAEKLILALPHFSFHWSSGEFMVGSLRAAIDRDTRHITISAPTLMSKWGDVYGVEDIGMKGIRNFFYWNSGSDNSICRRFEQPAKRKMYYDATPKNIVHC